MEKHKIKWLPPRQPRRKKRRSFGSHGDIAMIAPLELMQEIHPYNLNYWELHTTFRITTSLKDNIENVNGVEVIMIGSPYRMKLGFGKLFDQNVVRCDIQEVLKKHIKEIKHVSIQ